jgi:hypothetical protein
MKTLIRQSLLMIFCAAIQCGNFAFSQNNKKMTLNIAINSAEAQTGEREWSSWGYAKKNMDQAGAIRDHSFSGSIIPQFAIKDDLSFRVELGVTRIYITGESRPATVMPSSPPDLLTTMDQRIKQTIFRFVPGLQWNFYEKKPFAIHGGLTASYLNYSKMKYRNYIQTRRVSDNVLVGGSEDNSEAASGFAIGAGAFSGFDISVFKNISIGAECSFAFQYYKLGETFNSTVVSLTSPSTVVNVSSTSAGYKGFGFSKIMPCLKLGLRL